MRPWGNMQTMQPLREFLRGPTIGRPFITATGIASLSALVATLLLWVASYSRLFALSGGLPNDHRFLLNAWRGHTTFTLAAVSDDAADVFPRSLWLRTVEINPAATARLRKTHENASFRFRVLQSKQLPVQLKMPLWLPAIGFAAALVASPYLPLRFTIRTLLVLLTIGCLLLGSLAFVIHRAE